LIPLCLTLPNAGIIGAHHQARLGPLSYTFSFLRWALSHDFLFFIPFSCSFHLFLLFPSFFPSSLPSFLLSCPPSFLPSFSLSSLKS
jgi:hypothetical protein